MKAETFLFLNFREAGVHILPEVRKLLEMLFGV
jgi:hypothetical protein